jgi:uncharacterized phage protein (TIGR01671 family)
MKKQDRVIKFRAWDFDKKTFVYLMLCDGTYVYPISEDQLDKQMPIMQFTGLLDKNGKEIYEGDIVSVCGNEEGDADTMIVSWNKETLTYELLNHKGVKQNLYLYEVLDDEDDKTIVIGNIFENPELLK